MESLSDLLHQIVHALSVFSYSGTARIMSIIVGISMIAVSPFAVWKALQTRRLKLVYAPRFAWIQVVFMLSIGAVELTHCFNSETIHTYGLFADLVAIVSGTLCLVNFPKFYREAAEYQAAQLGRVNTI